MWPRPPPRPRAPWGQHGLPPQPAVAPHCCGASSPTPGTHGDTWTPPGMTSATWCPDFHCRLCSPRAVSGHRGREGGQAHSWGTRSLRSASTSRTEQRLLRVSVRGGGRAGRPEGVPAPGAGCGGRGARHPCPGRARRRQLCGPQAQCRAKRPLDRGGRGRAGSWCSQAGCRAAPR